MTDPITPNGAKPASTNGADEASRGLAFAGVAIGLVLLGLIVGAVLLAINAAAAGPSVEVVRDLLIIFMTVELIVIGGALVVLIVQIARFVNLMNNEVKPLVDSTRETLQTVRGTAAFLSKHMVEPVMQANSVLAGLGRVVKEVDVIREATRLATAAAVIKTEASGPAASAEPPEPSPAPTPEAAEKPAQVSDANKEGPQSEPQQPV
jgi:hypothetical protein